MELQAFTSQNCTELNPDIRMCLTELERKLAKHFNRVEIHGKRSRMVPVLLTPDMIAAMDLLVKNRNQCQVHTENVYLLHVQVSVSITEALTAFGRMHTNMVLRGTRLNKTAETSRHVVH